MLAQTRLLTVREVALTLPQSERTVRDKIASGDLAALRIGSGPRAPIRVEAAELEAFIHERTKP
jgi:excisionase family DNA binding protein